MAGKGGLTPALAAAAAQLPPGDVVVALSGGPDSAVAAWLLSHRPGPGAVAAVFVDHGWPGSASLRQAAAAIAAHLCIPLQIVTVAGSSTEGEARRLRLAALEAAAAGRPVVTGHHAGDVAETVVGNLLRGAGSTGLAGIPGARSPFVRPLLAVPSHEVRSLADAEALPFVDDPANADPAHRRNRIRHQVMPVLAAAEPSAEAAIGRAARLLGDDDRMLEDLAAAVPLTPAVDGVLIPFGALAAQPRPVAARIARRALRTVRPPYAGDAADVDRILAVARGTTLDLGGGLRCERDGAFVAVYDPERTPGPFPAIPLPVPGDVVVAGHAVMAAWAPERLLPPWRAEAALDTALAGSLLVRPSRPGEHIDIGEGSKPVAEALSEAAVGRRLRAGWPVVAARGKIAWLVGVRVAAWARAPATGTVLQLTARPTTERP